MSDSVHAARIVAYSGAVTAGFTLSDGWMVSLPFVGIVFIEAILYAHRTFDSFLGKSRDWIVERAATRAVELIDQRERDEDLMQALASLGDELPEDIVEAARNRRLQITVKDDE